MPYALLGPDGKVLDVGCGVGQVVQRLIDAGHEAHGVEVSEPNIAKAKKSATDADSMTAAVCRLTMPLLTAWVH